MKLGFFNGFSRHNNDNRIDDFVFKKIDDKPPVKMDLRVINDDDPFLIGDMYDNKQVYSNYNDDVSASILKWRQFVYESFEASFALRLITNEAVVTSTTIQGESVELDLTDLKYNDVVKDAIKESFNNVKRMLNWKNQGRGIFRKYYVDGQLNVLPKFDDLHKTQGVIGLEIISPFTIQRQTDPDDDTQEFYLVQTKDNEVYKIDSNLMVRIENKNYNPQSNIPISELDVAIKHYNRLDLLENAAIIYKLVRAPERRVFYVNRKKKPNSTMKAEMKDLIRTYSNKEMFDPKTGNIDSKKSLTSMVKDIWLTRDGDGKGTEVDTLPGGTAINQNDDIGLFEKKLIRSLNIPLSSYYSSEGLNFQLGTQVTEEKTTFFEHVATQRLSMNEMFINIMKIDLTLKRVIPNDEEAWNIIVDAFHFNWKSSSYFHDLKELEVFETKLDTVDRAMDYVGELWDKDFIYREILRWTDDKIEDMKTRLQEIHDTSTEDDDIDTKPPSGGGGGGGSKPSTPNFDTGIDDDFDFSDEDLDDGTIGKNLGGKNLDDTIDGDFEDEDSDIV